MKLADTLDLGSGDASHAGSSPVDRIMKVRTVAACRVRIFAYGNYT